ncbi:MAG: pyrroloquinoline quinone (PQQ) biosynthesis protein C [Alphaproteobacteria bacterium]|jgi:pyrroloquinoline quinone (PQQ) biosynthesis protein C
MKLYDRLLNETSAEKDYLMSAPIIQKCFTGDINQHDYIGFLSQAFHHVKHTVPLLMAVGTRLSDSQEWIREAVAEYIEEEIGHQEWILNDIKAAGGNKEQVRNSQPAFETELMVSYAYDLVNRTNPLGFFGMVHVLEGTSVAVADNAAESIQQALALPNSAFTYLRSHGAIDLEHVKFFEELMNKIEDKPSQDLIVNSAKKFYRLYADIFRHLGKTLTLEKAA